MGKKPNTMLANLEAKIRAEVTEQIRAEVTEETREEIRAEVLEEYKIKMGIALQMSLDAAFFAANEVFRMGPGRVQAFFDAYTQNYRDINRILSEDGKADDDLVYSTTVIDRRLKEIVGEKLFQPWEVRYEA